MYSLLPSVQLEQLTFGAARFQVCSRVSLLSGVSDSSASDSHGNSTHSRVRRNRPMITLFSRSGEGIHLPPMTNDERTNELCRIVPFMVRSIADQASSIVVDTALSEGGRTIISVHVSDSDRGKLIGREGQVADALRQYVLAYQLQHGGAYGLDILGS